MTAVIETAVPTTAPPSSFRREGDAISITLRGEARVYKVQALPLKFIEWIEAGRRRLYDRLLSAGAPHQPFMTHHLPVVATFSDDEAFPANLGNKGVGFHPKAQYLSAGIETLERTLRDTQDLPWRESLRRRVEAVAGFYFDREQIDYRCLTTLEIFERTTFRNLTRRPLASLMYTGGMPDYVSFQVNAAVEVVGQDDPRHRFIYLARSLFEYEKFHIVQPEFRYAYLFWIVDVLDKSPFQVSGKRMDAPGRAMDSPGGAAEAGTEIASDFDWTNEALAAVSRAPGMIQKHIREVIENYARQKGVRQIDAGLVEEARSVFMDAPGGALDAPGGALDGLAEPPPDEVRPEDLPTATEADLSRRVDVWPLWTPEALARLQRVPEGFMRSAAKSHIERYAREVEAFKVTLDVAEGGLARAREEMARVLAKRNLYGTE